MMIRVTNLFKQFNDQVVLDDMNFEIKEGQLVYILGESGSGKSVLLQHLIGLLKPDRGSIEIDGVDITKLPEKKLLKMRRNFGYLFQEGALYDFMNVCENIAFPLSEHTKLRRKDIQNKVQDILETVGLEEAA